MRIPVMILAILLMTVASACSSNNIEETPVAKPTLDNFVDKVTSDLGDEGAFSGVVLAYDGGYSLAQIVDAGMDGALSATGLIKDVDPVNEDAGAITSSSRTQPVALLVAERTTKAITNVSELRSWVKNAGFQIDVTFSPLHVLLEIVSSGYSAGQITEAFVFGYTLDRVCVDLVVPGELILIPDGDCRMQLSDEKGKDVKPDNARDTETFSVDSEAYQDSTEPAPGGGEDIVFDGDTKVFSGSGTSATSMKTPDSSPAPCVGNSASIELILFSDGRAELTISPGGHDIDVEPDQVTRTCTESEAISLTGKHSGGEFQMDLPFPSWEGELSGAYNNKHASGKGSFFVLPITLSYDFTDLPAK